MVSNVTMRNIDATVDANVVAGCLMCAPGDRKCTGWTFDNVTVRTHTGIPAANYHCIYFRNATAANSSPVPCGTGATGTSCKPGYR